MYEMALAIIILVSVIANLLLIAAVYFLPRLLVNAGRAVIVPSKPAWSPRRWTRAGIAAAIMIVVPLLLNAIHRYERSALVSGDKSWDGSISNIDTLALLTDSFEDKNWAVRGECGPRRCRALLSQHLVQAVLVGSPPPVGGTLDPSLKVTRYRLDLRPSCPPLDPRVYGLGAGASSGECVVADTATLADADIVVVDQRFNPPWRPERNTVHEWVIGGRLSLYQRDGTAWRELVRKTEVGGSDWLVPMLVGPLNRNLFGALMFGGGMIGFMTSQNVEAEPPDLDAWLKRWRLSAAEPADHFR